MHTYVKIVDAGLVSAGLPCFWLVVVFRCRLTRQLVVVSGANLSIVQQRDDQQTKAVFSPFVQFEKFTEQTIEFNC